MATSRFVQSYTDKEILNKFSSEKHERPMQQNLE